MNDSQSTDDPTVEAARAAHQLLGRARTTQVQALKELERAVRAAYRAHPELGPTALARAIGIPEGTLRGYTRDLARERRQTLKEVS
ncbi:hypothetical protein ACPPVT_14385 [Angustibacter sp. McL0619]|uniref:hypothetical protein n=1 Tax=Angustibacter sp. McL0619 TaxID=3415676 RepID=UPI003CF19D9A